MAKTTIRGCLNGLSAARETMTATRRNMCRVGFVLLSCAAAGCAGPGQPPADARSAHATTPSVIAYDSTRRSAVAHSSSGLHEWRTRLAQLTEDWSVGDVHGPFARISAALASSDNLFVADHMMNHVVVLGRDGTVLRTILREGDGPLEMRGLVGLAHGPNRELVVADGAQVKVLNAMGDSVIASIAPGTMVLDACGLGGSLMLRVLGPSSRASIMRIVLGDTARALFGRTPDADDQSMHMAVGRGRIACVDAAGVAVTTFDTSPDVIAYDTVGTVVWRATLHGFTTPEWRTAVVNGQSIRVLRQDRASDRIMALVTLPPDALLVQVGRFAPGEPGPMATSFIDSYILDARSGVGEFIGRGPPPVLAADSLSYWAVLHTMAGAQQVRAYRYKQSPALKN